MCTVKEITVPYWKRTRTTPTERLVVLVLSALVVPAAMQAQQNAGSPAAAQRVAGRVVDHTGAPLVNARVKITPLMPGLGRGNAASGADGSFAVPGLAAGIYQICADLPGQELLDPCLWHRTPIPVTVRDQPLPAVSVQLKRGAALTIRVNDAKKLLADAERTGSGHLLVGVWTATGVFVPAHVTAEDHTGRTYALTMPVGVSAKVSITPNGMKLQDAAGKLQQAGASVAVNVPASGQELRFAVLR